MTLIQGLILAIVQGLAEFLPISSKAHLNIAQHLLGLTPSLTFDIFLNTATLLSVLFYFRSQIPYFFKNLKYIIVGTIPAIFFGFLLKHKIEIISTDIHLLFIFFLVTATFLLITKFLKPQDKKLTYKKALIIGLFQSLALIPGLSRSGCTIFGGLIVGLSALEAFNFSFSLFIPASIGALVLDLKNIGQMSGFGLNYFISFAVSAIVGYIAIVFLKKVLTGHKLWYFSFYLFVLALAVLAI